MYLNNKFFVYSYHVSQDIFNIFDIRNFDYLIVVDEYLLIVDQFYLYR